MSPSDPNALWVADITYVRTWAGWLYVAVVVDAHSRMVVGWSMREDLSAELVVDAIQMALWRRQVEPGELVHHSDRGSQYTSFACGRTLREAGIAQSMGSRGDAYDNALAESFMSTLKTELIDRRSWPTRQAARTAIYDYIEAPHGLWSEEAGGKQDVVWRTLEDGRRFRIIKVLWEPADLSAVLEELGWRAAITRHDPFWWAVIRRSGDMPR